MVQGILSCDACLVIEQAHFSVSKVKWAHFQDVRISFSAFLSIQPILLPCVLFVLNPFMASLLDMLVQGQILAVDVVNTGMGPTAGFYLH